MPIETKWLKGPWDFDTELGQVVTPEETILDIDYCCTIDSDDQREATGHLIAAAPELYEALVEARRYVLGAYECAFPNESENQRILESVDAALAKARGELCR